MITIGICVHPVTNAFDIASVIIDLVWYTNMPYQYQSLPNLHDPEDVYIRLLELHEGPPSGPITGRLYSILLSKAPKFFAVSYCWGSPTQKSTIHLTNVAPFCDLGDDNTLEIPATLIPLLYRIRGWPVKARTLWIDSVCLNQMDNDEKTANVPKMRQVYMKAAVTVSWLGLEVEGTAAAFEYASRLHTIYIHEMADQGKHVLIAEEEKEEVPHVQVKVGDPALETLLCLLNRPYFERAWVIQEVIVSNEVWFLCGSAIITWSSLLTAYVYLMATKPWLWEFYPGLRTHLVLLMKFSEQEWTSGADVDCFGTLLRHRMCLSGDPRDKVYAFYGMRCKKALEDLGIEPNYDAETTTEVMYTRLAARALHKAHVAVLHVPRLIITPHEESDTNFIRLTLPSWVPDWRWTEATPMSLLLAEVGETNTVLRYHASADSIFKPQFDLETFNSTSTLSKHLSQLPKMLKLCGVTVAKVTQLTPRRWISRKTSIHQSLLEQAQLLQFDQYQIYEWEVFFRPKNPAQIYPATGELATRARDETIMAGTTQFAPEIKRRAWAAFEKRQNVLRLLHKSHIHGFLVCYIVVVLIERVLRRFGWTNPEAQSKCMVGHIWNRKGATVVNSEDSELTYYALVPSICQLGDHVVLVEGVTTPLVLRKKGEGIDATWEFIGDAYVHGIMKGELWEKRKGDRKDMWIT